MFCLQRIHTTHMTSRGDLKATIGAPCTMKKSSIIYVLTFNRKLVLLSNNQDTAHPETKAFIPLLFKKYHNLRHVGTFHSVKSTQVRKHFLNLIFQWTHFVLSCISKTSVNTQMSNTDITVSPLSTRSSCMWKVVQCWGNIVNYTITFLDSEATSLTVYFGRLLNNVWLPLKYVGVSFSCKQVHGYTREN